MKLFSISNYLLIQIIHEVTRLILNGDIHKFYNFLTAANSTDSDSGNTVFSTFNKAITTQNVASINKTTKQNQHKRQQIKTNINK